MDMQSAIAAVIEQQDLNAADMEAVMRLIMTGQATAAQIGGFLVGLRMKGETVDEIAARSFTTGARWRSSMTSFQTLTCVPPLGRMLVTSSSRARR